MSSLYRKIPCSKRLPEKSGLYDTDWGNLAFHISSKRWKDGFDVFNEIEWWLEPIQLPTDEEIEKMAIEKTSTRGEYLNYLTGFKSALKLLTGGK